MALPAVAPPETVAMSERVASRTSSTVSIPYSLTNSPWTQNPAVATEDAVFYAVNPYWQLFEGFIRYCNDPLQQGNMQLSAISSFSPITIWRVYPYVYCSPLENPAGCYEGLSTGQVIEASGRLNLTMTDCTREVDFIVTGMQYIDTENIAISVLRTTPQMINPRTMQPFTDRAGVDTVSRTVTYFLNTITMQIRENRAWSTEVPQAVHTQGQLCPAQRSMPQVGSMITETIVAGIMFVRMPLNVVLNGVYIFPQWTKERGEECPLITRGHTLLLTACGSQALSLKPFFDSARRASQLLFRSISIVARTFEGLPGSSSPRTFINGVKMYAENQVNPLSAGILGAGILKGFRLPLGRTASGLFSGAMRMPGYMRLFVLFGSPMSMANFLYHFVVDLIYRIVRASFTGVKPEAVFYATMYDFQQDFDETVMSTAHRACTGLSLAFGYTNPWALFIRHQCDAWASVPSGMQRFLNVFLVDIPTAKCICKDAQGNNFARYATDNCFKNAPDQVRAPYAPHAPRAPPAPDTNTYGHR